MSSHKVNPGKMRRYAARTTPDIVSASFDARSDTSQEDYMKWINAFMSRMKVKHGPHNVKINVEMKDTLGSEKIVTARVVHHEKKY